MEFKNKGEFFNYIKRLGGSSHLECRNLRVFGEDVSYDVQGLTTSVHYHQGDMVCDDSQKTSINPLDLPACNINPRGITVDGRIIMVCEKGKTFEAKLKTFVE